MKTITYTSLRANLSDVMEKVCEDHAPYIVTRNKAKPVVMVSLEDYQSIEETAYLLQSPVNAKRLTDAITEMKTLIGKEEKLKKKGKR